MVGPEPPDVEVVDDLVEQVTNVLDEGHIGLHVPGDTETHQHVETEPCVVSMVAASKSVMALASRS